MMAYFQATGMFPSQSDMERHFCGLILVFTAPFLLFKFQNLETATVSLFSSSITLPLSILVPAIYTLRGHRLRLPHSDWRLP